MSSVGYGGFPPQDNVPIFNTSPAENGGILYRSEDGSHRIGGPFQIGDHLRYTLSGLGYPRKFSWAIALDVKPTHIKAFWQDGSVQVWLRNDWKVQSGMYTYSVGDPVWYDVQPDGQNAKRGTIVSFLGQPPDVQTFTIRNVDDGSVVTRPFRDVILRADLPGNNPEVNSMYNVRTVDDEEP